MSDEKRRKLELEYTQTGVLPYGLFRHWVAHGRVSKQDLDILAYCNHPFALAQTKTRGYTHKSLWGFVLGFLQWEHLHQIMTLLLSTYTLKEFEKHFPDEQNPRSAVQAFLNWMLDSTDEKREIAIARTEALCRRPSLSLWQNLNQESEDHFFDLIERFIVVLRLPFYPVHTGLKAGAFALQFTRASQEELAIQAIRTTVVQMVLFGWRDYESLLPVHPSAKSVPY